MHDVAAIQPKTSRSKPAEGTAPVAKVHAPPAPAAPQLTVSSPEHPAEADADAFAEANTKPSLPAIPYAAAPPPPAKPNPANRSVESAAPTARVVNDTTSASIAQQMLGGENLPMEDLNGELSGLEPLAAGAKIHRTGAADQTAKGLNAEAFTVGNHIFFSANSYKPNTPQGKNLLAHELAHVGQNQTTGTTDVVRRRVYRGAETSDGLIPLLSDGQTLADFAADGIAVLRPEAVATYASIIVVTQSGLDVFQLATRRFVAHYGLRPNENQLQDGLWRLSVNGGIERIGVRGTTTVMEGRALEVAAYSTERQSIIAARGHILFLDDMTLTTAEELNRHNYLPAILVAGTLPATGTGTAGTGSGAAIASWAVAQSNAVISSLGVTVGREGRPLSSTPGAATGNRSAPDAPPSMRNTSTDASTPERLVCWARADGKQFVNVWVGGRNADDGGVVESIELHEGESNESLVARVQQATTTARGRLARNAQAEEDRITGGGVPLNDSTFRGGTSVGARANRSAFRASMRGPEVMVRNGTGAYNMSLHYEDEFPDLLGQVASAWHGSDFVWQVFDITALYQQVMRERAAGAEARRQAVLRGDTPAAPNTMPEEARLNTMGTNAAINSSTTVSTSAADLRDLSRRYHNYVEDAQQAGHDLVNPLSSQDGSSEAAIRSVLVNSFNLATLPLHGILSLGGWLVRAFSGVFGTDPQYEREVPFPNHDGFYLVRCVAQPRAIGEGENAVIRMPSVAVKVVEVKEIAARTRQELDAQDQNLQASILELLISFRTITDERQLQAISRMLEIKIQEAAQSNRGFLQQQINTRQQALAAPNLPETLQQKINAELTLLRQGTAADSGLISAIISRQIVLKEQELADARARNAGPFTERDIQRQIAQLRSRLTTATERESEMRGDGQAIVRPQAVFVNEEDGQSVPVLIELGQIGSRHSSRGYTMRLSDITGSSSDQHDAIGRTRSEAVRHAVAEYAGHFPYGRGYLTVRFPAGMNYGITEPIVVRCNPRDTAQASERLDELLQVLAIVGLFIPGVGVAVAAVGAAVSAGRILSRVNNHTFAWDSNTVMDVLNIVGAVAGGISQMSGFRLARAQRMFAVIPESEDLAAWVTRLSRFQRVVDFVDTSVNNVSYFLGSMETVANYIDIQRQQMSGAITAAEARRRRAQLLTQAMYDQFMQHAPGMVEHFRGDGTPVHPPNEDAPHADPRRDDTTALPETGTTPHAAATPHAHYNPPESRPRGAGRDGVLSFLAVRENVQALLRGDAAATRALLEAHGNWRDLIMMLQSEPHNDLYAYLVDAVGSYRQNVVADLRSRFNIDLSDPNASTHASSDIDLATTGADAGARMNAAERFMRERYGHSWSELLRMNFYTQAERLFMYEQVRTIMTDAAFGQLQARMTHLSEILNFAKMLQHAQGNAESIARVEQLMAHLSAAEQAQVRTRASEAPADAQARAGDLHQAIDALTARFEAIGSNTTAPLAAAALTTLPPAIPAHLRDAINAAVTPTELRIALAAAISEMQMEANFRTVEAYISPGAGRQVVRGVAVHGHEAYQSALANLEMMEHTLHEAGGNIDTAIREYELYKYINRFIVATQLAGLPTNAFMLAYYQAAYDVYRNNRTSLQGVNTHDLAYLNAMHRQFMIEAALALPQMRDAALRNPTDWNATPRSLRADDTSIRDLGTGPTAGAAPTTTNRLGTVASLLGSSTGLSAIGHVAILRNNALEGNATHARFENGRLVLELGPRAGHEQLRQHLDTLRVLQRYEGSLGLVRRLFSRIGELLGMGPGVGTAGFEARQEVQKLLGIRAELELQRIAIENAMTATSATATLADLQGNYSQLLNSIVAIENQMGVHEREINSTAAGRGHIAMANTLPTGPILTEASPRFGVEPNVGESLRYRDRGGTEGVVSRLSSDTVSIITNLGQSTIRANYQNVISPTAFGLPIGRHGFEALHAIGPNVGHESPYGIYFGPWRVNQLIQRIGIERFIGDVGSHLHSGRQVLLRVEVQKETHNVVQPDGSVRQADFLKQITYQLYGASVSTNNKLFELNITVARPNDPRSGVHYDSESLVLSHRLNDFTDMSRVADSFEPQFSATDPIDE
ncbi:MAG: DUF4157 domain-containing protein [Bacteroidetes bacterium]|nr:MAG: DUF4157 domain-containing protein [Bacteroidota bacterium]